MEESVTKVKGTWDDIQKFHERLRKAKGDLDALNKDVNPLHHYP